MTKKRKTLEDYWKKYPRRPGDTVEMFERYEDFCKRNPCPVGSTKDFYEWYAKLADHMEASA